MCTIGHDSGAVASHYHGFDQMTLMDRTDHRLVCEQGDIVVDGWIPLSLTVDAAMDEQGIAKLCEICKGASVETVETYDDQRGQTTGRGEQRRVSRRIRLEYCPQPDKQALYAQSVCELLSDQLAYIADRGHDRRIAELNGLDSLALAEAAARLAQKSIR